MEVFALSLSFRTASPETLEAVLDPSAKDRFVSWVAAEADLLEAVVLTTCLRLELYGVASDPTRLAERAREQLSQISGVPAVRQQGAVLVGSPVPRHLLRVAPGLDSLVPGETAVTGQVRRAYRDSIDRAFCGPWLHRLFHIALRAARQIRPLQPPTEPVPEAAVRLGCRHLDPSRVTLTVLGAGSLGRAVVAAARRAGVPTLRVVGSHREQVRALAQQSGARAFGPDETSTALADADVCIAASGRGRVLDLHTVRSRPGGRRALTVLDFGVPRNVDPRVADLDQVRLFGLEEIARRIDGVANDSDSAVERILADHEESYLAWLESRKVHPAARDTLVPRPATTPDSRPGAVEPGFARRARTSHRTETPVRSMHPHVHPVLLVGAGPGNPELLTVRALRALQEADIVFHDSLVPTTILDEIPRGTRRVPVGRRRGHVVCEQEQVHLGLINWAKRGARVVRLKGGDPFIFGRGGEEAEALAGAGVPVEIVPGVTAACAAAAAACVPLTHRGVARSFSIVTGHGMGDAIDPGALFPEAAGDAQTLAVYMSASRLPELARELLRRGRPEREGLVVVERASQEDERIHWFDLGRAAALGSHAHFGRPALVLVGPTVEIGARLCGARIESQTNAEATNVESWRLEPEPEHR